MDGGAVEPRDEYIAAGSISASDDEVIVEYASSASPK
jgi:hypothetical protein